MSHRMRTLGRLAALCLGTSALIRPAWAAVIDYPDGSNNVAPIVLTDNSTQLQVLNGSATQSGLISQSGGTFGIEKIGTGTLILANTNSYAGPTRVSAGTLQLGAGGGITASNALIIAGGATFAAGDGNSTSISNLSSADPPGTPRSVGHRNQQPDHQPDGDWQLWGHHNRQRRPDLQRPGNAEPE